LSSVVFLLSPLPFSLVLPSPLAFALVTEAVRIARPFDQLSYRERAVLSAFASANRPI
jgi:hypothetical protein